MNNAHDLYEAWDAAEDEADFYRSQVDPWYDPTPAEWEMDIYEEDCGV